MTLAPPQDIVTALRDWGLTVKEWPGWRTRGTGYRFDPYAQAWHHDAFAESFGDEAAARYMAEQGRPDLRPPLCNGAIGNFGTVFLIAYGNANHAGWNEADVHDRLRRGLAPLGDAAKDPDRDSVVGNPHLWGWECRNAGTGQDPWDQLDVMERTGAAFAEANGWAWEQNVGHRELTARKVDPRGFDMHAFRADIARLMEDDMTPDQEHKLDEALGLLRSLVPRPPQPVTMHGDRIGQVATDGKPAADLWRWGLESLFRTRALDPAALAQQIAERLPSTAGPVKVTDLEQALRNVFGSLDEG